MFQLANFILAVPMSASLCAVLPPPTPAPDTTIYFRKKERHRSYCNFSLQTRSLGFWISAYLSQVHSIFDFPSGLLLWCLQKLLTTAAMVDNLAEKIDQFPLYIDICSFHPVSYTTFFMLDELRELSQQK